MANLPPSLDDAQRFLALISRPGDVFELRGLGKNSDGRPHVTTGYFDSLDDLARAAADRSGKDIGVYVTLNPVLPALLARAPKNRVRRAGNGDTTSDRDVRTRRSILVDVDPVRPQGISSTDEEHTAALELATTIARDLGERGWPTPIVADSGNGGHLIYAVDLPVDDSGLVKRVLEHLSRRYSTSMLKIDEKVFNPARISKIYGTLTRKGEDVPERPHRLARLLTAPTVLDVVTREMLEAFAPVAVPRAAHGTHPPPSGEQRFDVDAFIALHLPDAISMSWSEGRKWLLPVCPFNAEHDRKEAFICEKHSGQLSAGCLHDSCRWQWEQLRGHFEPDYAERRRRYENGNGTNGQRVSHREPPPEVVYQDPDYAGDVDAAADRDREPTPPVRPTWRCAPDLVDDIWSRKDEPWIDLKLSDDSLCSVRPGGIAVVMGGSGSGKSSLVSCMLVQHARDMGPAIAMSIELPADELAARIVGIRCDSGWETVLRGGVAREHMVTALALPRLFVLDRDHATLENLPACIEAARAEYPGQPILVAIDYAQLVQSKEREMRMRVSDAFERIDRMARSCRVVTIAVSQMSRAGATAATSGEKIGAETSQLGAESAAIERFSTVTISIGQKGEPAEDGSSPVELSIGKGRMSGGDRVVPSRYWGRSGLWRVTGAPIAASQVRSERETAVSQKKQTAAELTMLGAAQKSTGPLTKEELCELIIGNAQMKRAAVAALIARGDLVEVRQRRSRSRSWLLWTSDRAVDAGLQLVRDMPQGSD